MPSSRASGWGIAAGHLVVLHRGPAHDINVGTREKRRKPAFALCVLISLLGTAGCVYEYPEPVHTPTVGPGPGTVNRTAVSRTPATGATNPDTDPLVLQREAENYTELYRLLMRAPGQALLFEVGPLDGPSRGFGGTEKVASSGRYRVTAACVGAHEAKIAVGQEHPGAPFRPMEIALDCPGVTSKLVAYQQGYVFAHLVLPGPGANPWTGAVGGVRVTAPEEALTVPPYPVTLHP